MPPQEELVPPQVLRKVLSIARGGGLVVEMLWSTSPWLGHEVMMKS